jgi:hypothetical protein
MSTVIARDTQAEGQLVYTWPYPIGAECDVSCSSDEEVVMCPAWVVGNRLGPGRHRWRTPDPTRPSTAYFVSTSPIEVDFDLVTTFVVPLTRQTVRVRATGAVTVRCTDPLLLISQFVGLPFYDIDKGLRQSVSRSIERILARLLVRRTVTTGSALALVDKSVRSAIVEELVAFHPTGGAVFGLEFYRLLALEIAVDDGVGLVQELGVKKDPVEQPPQSTRAASNGFASANGSRPETPAPVPNKVTVMTGVVDVPMYDESSAPVSRQEKPERNKNETVRGRPPLNYDELVNQAKQKRVAAAATLQSPVVALTRDSEQTIDNDAEQMALHMSERNRHEQPFGGRLAKAEIPVIPTQQIAAMSALPILGQRAQRKTPSMGVPAAVTESSSSTKSSVSGEIVPKGNKVRQSESAAPAVSRTSTSRKGSSGSSDAHADHATADTSKSSRQRGDTDGDRGAIMAIGAAGGLGIGTGKVVSGEVSTKIPAGGRVLVQGSNGLMQSAVVRQLLAGYYELEVGSTGEVVWVPMALVVPKRHLRRLLGRIPISLEIIPSMISSVPPPIDISRVSRYARDN